MKLLEFVNLGRNGELLFFLVFGGLAAVDKPSQFGFCLGKHNLIIEHAEYVSSMVGIMTGSWSRKNNRRKIYSSGIFDFFSVLILTKKWQLFSLIQLIKLFVSGYFFFS